MFRNITLTVQNNETSPTPGLPDNFFIKLNKLENDLGEGKLNHDGLKELFEIYTVKLKKINIFLNLFIECFKLL